MRDHPIPPVTEPLQYRAIGLFRGTYRPESLNCFTRGHLVDEKGEEVEAVVLGRVITLMKRHLSMENPHLWVVYPRSRDSDNLHLQISGIWEPSTLKSDEEGNTSSKGQDKTSELDSDEVKEGDNYFSIRGELVYTKPESNDLVVKVRQRLRSSSSKPLPFKLRLKGSIPLENLRHFVSLDVRRNGQFLILEDYEVLDPIPTRGGKSKSKNLSSKYRK